MSERRSLIEGLKQTPAVDPRKEQQFVFQGKPGHAEEAKPVNPPTPAPAAARAPISTRIRADFVAALKRASLERQLNQVEPHTLQDILEEAIEPWLKSHGYLP